MRNRAKCRLCNSVIESFHSEDYVTCKCDEIAVYGGAAMRCAAKSFDNFLRVDDEGNEIVPIVTDVQPLYKEEKPTRKELMNMLQALIASIEALPSHALHAPTTHHDLLSALILLSSILRAET